MQVVLEVLLVVGHHVLYTFAHQFLEFYTLFLRILKLVLSYQPNSSSLMVSHGLKDKLETNLHVIVLCYEHIRQVVILHIVLREGV